MTSAAPYKTFHRIIVSPCREVPGRRDWLAPTVKGPSSRVPSILRTVSLWVPVLATEPMVSSFFCLKNSGSQTLHMHPNLPTGLLSHRWPASILSSWQSAFLASSQMLQLWEPQARNHLLSDPPALSSTKLNWPMGWPVGIRLLTTFQFSPSQFYYTNN